MSTSSSSTQLDTNKQNNSETIEIIDSSQIIQNVSGKKTKIRYNDFFYCWKQNYKSAKEYICCEKRKANGSCRAKLKFVTASNQWIGIGQHNHDPPNSVTAQSTRLTLLDQRCELNSKKMENPFELVTCSQLAFTQDGQPFIRDGKFCPSLSIMFASSSQLYVLNSITEKDEIFFHSSDIECCYNGVIQLITILVKKPDSLPYPVFSVITDSKEEEDYLRVWKKVAKMCPNLKLATKLFITVDFQIAMHNSVRKVLPNAEINGCSVHWLESINRWLDNNRSQYDVIKQPKASEKLQSELKQICECKQRETFSSLLKNFEQYFSIIDLGFVTYLKQNYFNFDAPFPPTVWAHSQMMKIPSNSIELFSKKMDDWFKNKPSLKQSVLILQRAEYLARVGRLYEEQNFNK